jgi:hypothetical protein
VDEEETSFYNALSDHPSKSANPTSNDSDPDPDPVPNSGVGREDDDDLSPGLDCSLNPDGYWGANAHSTC